LTGKTIKLSTAENMFKINNKEFLASFTHIGTRTLGKYIDISKDVDKKINKLLEDFFSETHTPLLLNRHKNYLFMPYTNAQSFIGLLLSGIDIDDSLDMLKYIDFGVLNDKMRGDTQWDKFYGDINGDYRNIDITFLKKFINIMVIFQEGVVYRVGDDHRLGEYMVREEFSDDVFVINNRFINNK
jgi:hypothetical protein